MTEFLQEMVEKTLSSGSILAYAAIFFGGVVAGFTPCVYPVLPLTIGYIGNSADGKKGRAALLSVILVGGMALIYAVVGMIVTAIGVPFGSLLGNGWVLSAIAVFFMLMALFLMDVFTFPTLGFLGGLSGKASKRKGMVGALLVGGATGLVVGPCTGPILAVVLLYISTGLREAHGLAYAVQVAGGGLKLFLFGLGQGALIVICGIFAGLLTRLPKAGQWMVWLKKGFALIIMLWACLLFIFIGQNTNFPLLTGLLAGGSSASEEEVGTVEETSAEDPPDGDELQSPSVEQSNQAESLFGGDEFLEEAGADFGPVTDPMPEPIRMNGPAPDFTLETHDGKSLTLSRLKGKRAVILDFGTTTCPYCMQAIPHVKKFVERNRDKNVLLYMVNYKQSKRVVEKLVKDKALNYRVLLDSDGRVTAFYGITGFPTIVFIDADGIIRYASHAMPQNEEKLVEILTAPLEKEETPTEKKEPSPENPTAK